MKKIFGIMIALIVISACKKTTNPLNTYDRATLLKSLAQNVITPAYSNLNNAVPALQTAANNFAAAPNSANLQALRTAFDSTLAKWELCEVYAVEYADANLLSANIAAPKIDTNLIENFIRDTTFAMNQNAIATTGTTRKGLAAIEYLIFGDDQTVLNSFTSSARRTQYLQALAQDIQVQATAVYNDWNGGNSYNNFISQTQLDISGSLNLLVNAFSSHIEYVRATKIGKPAGLETSTNVDGSLCEYTLSQNSLNNIRANIQSWKNIYNGNGGVGLNNYLDHVNAQYNGASLSATINATLDTCLINANAITVPLDQAVTSQATAVAALHLQIKKLTVLTKVDAASDLGVIITFSDNDGD